MKKGAAGNFYSMMPGTLMKKYSLSCFRPVIIIFFRCPKVWSYVSSRLMSYLVNSISF